MIEPDLYRRLVNDLRVNGRTVIADLTGPPLAATLAGGVQLLRLSAEELVLEGCAGGETLEELRDAGARRVLVSRAAAGVGLARDPELTRRCGWGWRTGRSTPPAAAWGRAPAKRSSGWRLM